MSNPQRSLKSVTREDFVRIKELCEESIEVIHRKQCVKQPYHLNVRGHTSLAVANKKRISNFFLD